MCCLTKNAIAGVAAATSGTPATLHLLALPTAPQINARISKTTHLKEMNFEIEKLKQMLIATREKNGAEAELLGRLGIEGLFLQAGCSIPGCRLAVWSCPVVCALLPAQTHV